MVKKGGKKGKKKTEMATDDVALKPFGVSVNDMIQTPLGVEATVVGLDVGAGVLVLKWPGDITSPMPSKCKSKADMEAFGYVFEHKFYGGPLPKTAAMKLPQPGGVDIDWTGGAASWYGSLHGRSSLPAAVMGSRRLSTHQKSRSATGRATSGLGAASKTGRNRRIRRSQSSGGEGRPRTAPA